MFPTFQRFHVFDHVALFLCGVLTGITTGTLINAINGWISSPYFDIVYDEGDGVPFWNIIKRGMSEGFNIGIDASAAFTLAVFYVSTGACRFSFSVRYFLKIAIVTWLFWLIGGFNGSFVCWFFPDLFQIVRDLQGTWVNIYRFSWIGGSIHGVYFGSLFALFCGCARFKRDWNRLLSSTKEL
jgi:hypothetical protein